MEREPSPEDARALHALAADVGVKAPPKKLPPSKGVVGVGARRSEKSAARGGAALRPERRGGAAAARRGRRRAGPGRVDLGEREE